MAFTDALLPEFDHEMATTRKLLERVPADLGWKPHDKSMSLGRLATHLAEIPQWARHIICEDEIDLTGEYTPRVEKSAADIVALFDQATAECRREMAACSSTPVAPRMAGPSALSTSPSAIIAKARG
jgi:hypothetical protein